MKKMFIITLTLMLLVAALSGCVDNSVQPEPAVPAPTSTPTPTQAAGLDVPPSPGASAKIAAKGDDVQGKLNGWIDESSVEIEINPEDTAAFRVSNVLDQLKDIEDGAMVKFSYEGNADGQLIITKIEKVE